MPRPHTTLTRTSLSHGSGVSCPVVKTCGYTSHAPTQCPSANRALSVGASTFPPSMPPKTARIQAPDFPLLLVGGSSAAGEPRETGPAWMLRLTLVTVTPSLLALERSLFYKVGLFFFQFLLKDFILTEAFLCLA